MTIKPLRNSQRVNFFGRAARTAIELPSTSLCKSKRHEYQLKIDIFFQEKNLLVDPSSHKAGMWIKKRSSKLLLGWTGYAIFHITKEKITIFTYKEFDLNLLQALLLGPVAAVYLTCLDLLVLHGSAVKIGSKGIAFLGDKGAGKSTTALALLAQGFPLVTDDLLVVDFSRADDPHVVPAPPCVKVYPEIVTAFLGIDGGQLPSVYAGINKRNFAIPEHLQVLDSVPLAKAYGLKRGGRFVSNRLSSSEALKIAVEQTYIRRWGTELFRDEVAARLLRQTADLVRNDLIGILEVPADEKALLNLRGLLEGEIM